MKSTDVAARRGPRLLCPAMSLPPELWLAILCLFNTKDFPSARRQIMRVALVSQYFYALALPILYTHLPLFSFPANRARLEPPHDPHESILTIPAVAALTTLSSRPHLFPAVRSVHFLGHLDTVLLTRRTSTRTSDIIVSNKIRDLLTVTLSHLTSLRSIIFSAVAITSGLCNALFNLPALTELTLEDCRAPAPACSIFRDRPGDIRLTSVSLIFSAWTDTPGEMEVLSAFVHGPHLEELTTDQPRVLGSLLVRNVPPRLRRLELQNLGEGDAQVVVHFLAKGRGTLRELTFVNCESATWVTEVDEEFPRLPELRFYTGPRELARLFVTPKGRVERVKLLDIKSPEDDAELSDLHVLASSSKLLRSLDIRLRDESLVDDATWAALADLFPSLQVLRVAHDMPPEEFQVRTLPKCRAALSSLPCLENLALIFATHIPDYDWQRAVVQDFGRYQPTLKEVAFDPEATWIRFATDEWKLCPTDDS